MMESVSPYTTSRSIRSTSDLVCSRMSRPLAVGERRQIGRQSMAGDETQASGVNDAGVKIISACLSGALVNLASLRQSVFSERPLI